MPDVFAVAPYPNRSEADLRHIADLIVRSQYYFDAQAWDECEPLVRELLTYPEFSRQPLSHDAHGSVLERQGNMRGAMQAFRRALVADPTYPDARSRLIMILDALPDTTVEDAQRERDVWWQYLGAENYKRRKPHLNNRDPDRRLRVGYMSGDYQYHSAAGVFERIALRHSDAFLPFFYSTTPHDKHDHKTAEYQMRPGWRDLRARDGSKQGRPWPDTLIWDKIRSDEIDILVDLSGYTACNSLPVFCFKPAPVQITGWGYATGVGWKAMDYLISDRVVVPEDRQHEHVEKVLYLPCVINYEPMDGLPAPNTLPCLTERPTFGVFQRSLKFNAEDMEVWRRILERLPESRLLLKSHYPQTLIAWITSHFGAQASQVEFQPLTSSLDHKRAYHQVDLSLDPWPQTGGVSSCDSLWMGVPPLTLIGPRVIQRTTASLLTVLGLTEFITETPEAYIDQAVTWVTTRKHELAAIRAGLRERCDTSPIRHGYRDAAETLYRQVWRDWCATPLSVADAAYRLEMVS